jgi:serine/threonine protein kinase
MSPDRWQKINELFEAALAQPPHERSAFLFRSCGGDEELRRQIEGMLAADAQGDLLIDRPVFQAADALLPAHKTETGSFTRERIGTYRLVRQLGRGGMGVVYLADDTRLGRQVALKLLPVRMRNDADRVRRFQHEARSVSALNHPNIITVHDFGEEDGHYYIATEFVAGRTVRELISTADFTLQQTLELVLQVASALEAAHQAGIIHRDIKPENIMLRPDGYVKVLDFGLAKLVEAQSAEFDIRSEEAERMRSEELRRRSEEAETLLQTPSHHPPPAIPNPQSTIPGLIIGTPRYMSPEQARGQKVDARSDLFSLGVVLYELLTGQRPFDGATPHHVLLAIQEHHPPPLARYVKNAPQALQDIVSRLLAKERDARYASASELQADLKTLRDELTSDPRLQPRSGARVEAELAPTVTGRDVRHTLSRLQPFRLGAVLTLLLLALAVGWFYFKGSFQHPALTNRDTILLADWQNQTGDPIFEGTLRQGLIVQLAQSPFLNILPEERARETLRLMGRAREQAQEEKITREIGREICQRRGLKALLVGTIVSLGHNYVITLETINSQTGEVIVLQQTEAESREQVLKALGQAAIELREKLGESLASIQQFNAPIEQATTASLEALQDFSVGVELQRKGQQDKAIPFFRRATERDNEFALAHLRLGIASRDLRNLAYGNQQLERAWQLRHRVSERERLSIAATYYRYITGELERRLEATSMLTQTWPQDAAGHHIHGNSLVITGAYERAVEAYRAALRLDADYALSRANLALSLIGLNRFEEARATIAEGQQRGADITGFHNRLFLLAFLNGDAAEMNRQAEWYAGRPDEYQMREWQARAAASRGQRRQADDYYAQAAALAEARGLFTEQSRILASAAHLHALFGLTTSAQQQTTRVLALLAAKHVAPEELQLTPIMQLEWQPPAWTLALCGEAAQAQTLAHELHRQLPLDTLTNQLWLPLIRATIELQRGDHAGAERALQLLQPARQYEGALGFRLAWLRGQAYWQAGNAALATAEFERILAHRGWDVLSPFWSLAHLSLARAAALQGDVKKSQQQYEAFFTLWKEADANLPVLLQARQEFDKLKTK